MIRTIGRQMMIHIDALPSGDDRHALYRLAEAAHQNELKLRELQPNERPFSRVENDVEEGAVVG